jgi:hypothetical protein
VPAIIFPDNDPETAGSQSRVPGATAVVVKLAIVPFVVPVALEAAARK